MTDNLGYAVKTDFSSWRACRSTDALAPDETFHNTIPNEALQIEEQRRASIIEARNQAVADRDTLRAEYQQAITQLQNIENDTSPTNAEVVLAVKFLAKIVRLMLRFLARI